MLRTFQSRGTTMSRRARRVGRVCSVAFVASVAVLAHASSASASGAPNHSHFLTTPGSGNVVQVGPRVCENPDVLHHAFHQFHANVHNGAPTDTGELVITRDFC